MAVNQPTESESVYFLKILLYFILGTIWIQWRGGAIFPLGLALGLVFAHHDHFKLDRKLEYVILLLATFLALHGQGLFVNLT